VRDAVVQELGEDLELADEDGDGGFVEGRHFCCFGCFLSWCVKSKGEDEVGLTRLRWDLNVVG
jgi:hypothetical protein